MKYTPTRDDAFNLLKKYNKSGALINHGLAVEGVMRHFAKKYNEDEDKWGIIGLAHDLDYEMYPEHHCIKTKEILEENKWPAEYIRAIISHGWGICNDIEPILPLEKTLYTIDELTGFITACALVRPSKSVMDLEVKSVKKKWKVKKFAAGVNRDTIINGAKMMNIELNDLIHEVIIAMRKIAQEIGL